MNSRTQFNFPEPEPTPMKIGAIPVTPELQHYVVQLREQLAHIKAISQSEFVPMESLRDWMRFELLLLCLGKHLQTPTELSVASHRFNQAHRTILIHLGESLEQLTGAIEE